MTRRPSLLARVFRRSSSSRVIDRKSPPAAAVAAGARTEEWLVVGNGGERAAHLASALAASGRATTYVSREADGGAPPAAEGLRVLSSWDLSALREDYMGRTNRLRVLVGVADAETIALARDLAEYGARVAYDAPAPTGDLPGPLSYDAQTERALIDTVEDLVGSDARTMRHVSVQAGGRRLVHMVPDAGDPAAWAAAADSLAALAPRPSVSVLLATGPDPVATIEAVNAFEAARSDGAYRLAVIAAARDPASDALDELEEEGRVTLYRSARDGRVAAWNLGLSATRSEIVALAHASQRPDGAGWLTPALEALATQRETGAVGLRPLLPPGALGEVKSRLGAEALRVAALDGLGLVAPRAVLRRVGGFDESLEPGGLSAVELSFRIRELGFGLALCPPLGLRGGERDDAPTDRLLEKELRRRWSHRRDYLAGLP
ncbi:MAG: hypothetical protein P8R42_12690 [Candidatus Binatia bacterium]|nr:hypothetical protein [Candidatus Binatia bacterium]